MNMHEPSNPLRPNSEPHKCRDPRVLEWLEDGLFKQSSLKSEKLFEHPIFCIFRLTRDATCIYIHGVQPVGIPQIIQVMASAQTELEPVELPKEEDG